jgi:hypothetical protein
VRRSNTCGHQGAPIATCGEFAPAVSVPLGLPHGGCASQEETAKPRQPIGGLQKLDGRACGRSPRRGPTVADGSAGDAAAVPTIISALTAVDGVHSAVLSPIARAECPRSRSPRRMRRRSSQRDAGRQHGGNFVPQRQPAARRCRRSWSSRVRQRSTPEQTGRLSRDLTRFRHPRSQVDLGPRSPLAARR